MKREKFGIKTKFVKADTGDFALNFAFDTFSRVYEKVGQVARKNLFNKIAALVIAV